jgi:hypothetical protein
LRRLDLGLRTADALNIAIAQRIRAALPTFDQKLAASARVLGIPVVAAWSDKELTAMPRLSVNLNIKNPVPRTRTFCWSAQRGAPHFERNFGGENGFEPEMVLPQELQNLMFRMLRKAINATQGTTKIKTWAGAPVIQVNARSNIEVKIMKGGKTFRFRATFLLR